jgi:hypothetical protein
LSSEIGHLNHLFLGNLGDFIPAENVLPPIFAALETAPLPSLRLHYKNISRTAIAELGEMIEKSNSILTLELIFQPKDWSPYLERILLDALSENWNIEDVWVVTSENSFFPRKRWPDTTLRTSINKAIQGLVQRNSLKKEIDSMPVHISREEKDEWMTILRDVWDLPNGLDLAFCLLQTRPGCFF